MEEQSFAFEKVDKGIRILRCYGASGRVVIPEELEGLAVTELADYAFAEEMDGEPEHSGGLPCICGEALEELYLPRTIRRLGRYVFYNCIGFRKLSFYSNISYMGAGGFTGCGKLAHLVCRQQTGPSCLREILQDLKQSVAVECYWDGPLAEGLSSGGRNRQDEPERSSEREKAGCRLVYPEFFEEAVENTPARIISTQTHGMGIQYRNTFQNTRIIFSEYDKLFETGKYNMDLTDNIKMSAARLSCPWELSETAEKEYSTWLRQHIREGAAYFLEQEQREALKWMAESFAETREELEQMIQAAGDRKNTELLSVLMDICHRRFPGKRKRFDLFGKGCHDV